MWLPRGGACALHVLEALGWIPDTAKTKPNQRWDINVLPSILSSLNDTFLAFHRTWDEGSKKEGQMSSSS